jgi:hypothetical protein
MSPSFGSGGTVNDAPTTGMLDGNVRVNQNIALDFSMSFFC